TLADRVAHHHVRCLRFLPRMTSVGWVKFVSMSHVMFGGGGAVKNSGAVRALSSHIVWNACGSRSVPPGGSWNTASTTSRAALTGSPALLAATAGAKILARSSRATFPSGLSAGSTDIMLASYRTRLRTSDGFFT